MVYSISTHTPLARRDLLDSFAIIDQIAISTHTPLARRDEGFLQAVFWLRYFYSHAPCGARPQKGPEVAIPIGISTHTPHAGRDQAQAFNAAEAAISTHTPHAGRDLVKGA